MKKNHAVLIVGLAVVELALCSWFADEEKEDYALTKSKPRDEHRS